MIEYDFLEKKSVEQLNTKYGRFYRFEGKIYPSVTTVITKSLKDEGLKSWREWVGEEEANRITTQACNRGTAVHRIAEKYILSEDYRTGEMPVNLYDFEGMKPHLEKITRVYGCEYPLGSHEIATVGTTDCLCEFDGVTAVLDFKTARRAKKEEFLYAYFLQTTTYAMMAEEMYKMAVPRVVVILAVDHERPGLYVRDSSELRPDVWRLFNRRNYRSIWGHLRKEKEK